ncbi:hypothetical protein RRG08_065982 [Elysia crispata]|uniref:Uncharacterized protein n=1 Tax=Elysia crispata TaxID=231223 RepID=A0AAE1A5X6_9GAST|nr:hypothetical protein RRG08_065982 [Elysia crispata]
MLWWCSYPRSWFVPLDQLRLMQWWCSSPRSWFVPLDQLMLWWCSSPRSPTSDATSLFRCGNGHDTGWLFDLQRFDRRAAGVSDLQDGQSRYGREMVLAYRGQSLKTT